jgi:hypothetical protein
MGFVDDEEVAPTSPINRQPSYQHVDHRGQLSAHAAEFWFPESRNCNCCKGFKHGCSCVKGGVIQCQVCLPGAEAAKSSVTSKATEPIAEVAKPPVEPSAVESVVVEAPKPAVEQTSSEAEAAKPTAEGAASEPSDK